MILEVGSADLRLFKGSVVPEMFRKIVLKDDSCPETATWMFVEYLYQNFTKGAAVAKWSRYCATNQKVVGSIPDGVTELFIDVNPSDRAMALGSTQPLTERVPGVFPGGKCGRCVRLITLPPSCAVVKKSGNLNFLEPSGPPQACNGTPFRISLTASLCLM
jgi:hypothetical protein